MTDRQAIIVDGLREVAPDRHKVEFRTDGKGVTTASCILDDSGDLLDVAGFLAGRSARLSDVIACSGDKPDTAGLCEIAYHFDLDGDTLSVTVHVRRDGEIDSIASLFPNADWPERDMAELSGVRLKGHVNGGRTALSGEFMACSTMVDAATLNGLWAAEGGWKQPVPGPQVDFGEPLYFKVDLEGDTVTGLDIRPGRARQGVNSLTARRNIQQAIVLTERACPQCSNSHPFAYCMAIERIGGIVVPERGDYLRVIADEIKRISSHLLNLAFIVRGTGLHPFVRRIMETREIVQDVQEAIFGNRVNLAANRIGGARYDLDDDAAAYFAAQLERMKAPFDDFLTLCETNGAFLRRTKGIGVLPREDALRFGLAGPVARASGIDRDVRRKAPYASYDRLDFDVLTLSRGDVWSRAMIRLRDVRESVRIIGQCLRDLPAGPISVDGIAEIPAGEAIAKSEAPHGELIYYLRTDGSDKPARLKWRVPSHDNWKGLQVMMTGCQAADIAIIVASIDPCLSCTAH